MGFKVPSNYQALRAKAARKAAAAAQASGGGHGGNPYHDGKGEFTDASGNVNHGSTQRPTTSLRGGAIKVGTQIKYVQKGLGSDPRAKGTAKGTQTVTGLRKNAGGGGKFFDAVSTKSRQTFSVGNIRVVPTFNPGRAAEVASIKRGK